MCVQTSLYTQVYYNIIMYIWWPNQWCVLSINAIRSCLQHQKKTVDILSIFIRWARSPITHPRLGSTSYTQVSYSPGHCLHFCSFIFHRFSNEFRSSLSWLFYDVWKLLVQFGSTWSIKRKLSFWTFLINRYLISLLNRWFTFLNELLSINSTSALLDRDNPNLNASFEHCFLYLLFLYVYFYTCFISVCSSYWINRWFTCLMITRFLLKKTFNKFKSNLPLPK